MKITPQFGATIKPYTNDEGSVSQILRQLDHRGVIAGSFGLRSGDDIFWHIFTGDELTLAGRQSTHSGLWAIVQESLSQSRSVLAGLTGLTSDQIIQIKDDIDRRPFSL